MSTTCKLRKYPQDLNFASCDWIPFSSTRESLSRYGSASDDRSVALSLYALIDSLARYRVQASDYGLHDYTTKCFTFIIKILPVSEVNCVIKIKLKD